MVGIPVNDYAKGGPKVAGSGVPEKYQREPVGSLMPIGTDDAIRLGECTGICFSGLGL